MRQFTVNVLGIHTQEAKDLGYNAYASDLFPGSEHEVTAIEVQANGKRLAREKVQAHGFKVLYVFE